MHYIKICLYLLIQKLMPVKKKRIVFTSFNGHYSDNPKYISKKICELDKDLDIVWLVKEEYKDLVPENVKWVDIDNKWHKFWYNATSYIAVDNVYGDRAYYIREKSFWTQLKFNILSFLKNKKNQHLYTTWHGTPLKRMGKDRITDTIIDFSCPNTEMVLGNEFTLEVMDRIAFNKITMKLLGTPRNDILFDRRNVLEIKEKLSLPQDKKIILFAPTFRDNGIEMGEKNIYRSGINQLKEMDFKDLFDNLSEKYGGDWAIVCRFHYHVEEMVDWESLQKEYPGQIINGNEHDDMAEYLACTDVLITDASSSMFDFMLTKRPCFLFFPDLEYYQNEERGFYKPIEELPFPVSVDFDGLIENIKKFDEETYIKGVENLIEEFGYVDDANSSERVARYILDEMKKK